MSWVRAGDGLVGWGCAARLDTSGTERFTEADTWWQDWVAQVDVDDEVGLPGTGPVAFASMAFAEQPGRSVVIVPEVVIGQRDGVRWLTTIGEPPEAVAPVAADPGTTRAGSPVEPLAAGAAERLAAGAVEPVRHPGTVRYSDGTLTATGYRQAVADAVRRMREVGDLDKIVLAHDLLATTSEPLDSRFLLRNLAARYENCWTFAVDGLVGATPELLLERSGRLVRSRVLAGTVWPRGDRGFDELEAELLMSGKNRSEHEYATQSLADSLRPFCDELFVPGEPEVLRLRNVMHLASNVTGQLGEDRATLLRMTEAVHPTAAVGGTPTPQAVKLIGELEGMDRGRYAGPVGWTDSRGDGEVGIALRCAQIQPEAGENGQVRLFAGCGIVADSDPDLEVAEAEAKFLPVREALEGIE
ncbi:isochorismate synthase [Saccharopolyspora taberi]|uniref:isochorismate synthase n=1 Tax=Saccharopolyspora taberi TaxID=60895 RepID=A0ABN3VMZ1_9PSEU